MNPKLNGLQKRITKLKKLEQWLVYRMISERYGEEVLHVSGKITTFLPEQLDDEFIDELNEYVKKFKKSF